MKSLIYCALLIVIVSGAVAYNPDDHDSSSPTTSTNPVRAENMTVTASTPVEAGNSSSIKTGDAGNSSGIEPTPSDSDDSTESTWTWNCTDDKLRNRLKESLRPNETLNSLFSDVFIVSAPYFKLFTGSSLINAVQDTEWRLRNRRVPSSELLHVQLCVGNLPELCHHSMPKEVQCSNNIYCVVMIVSLFAHALSSFSGTCQSCCFRIANCLREDRGMLMELMLFQIKASLRLSERRLTGLL